MRSWRASRRSRTTWKLSATPQPPAELIDADRIASHLRVVQSSFAEVLTDFVRDRNPGVANIDLAAEVAGSALSAALVVAVENWGRNGCLGDLGELVAASLDLVRSGLAPLT